jgi:hypothetical protein
MLERIFIASNFLSAHFQYVPSKGSVIDLANPVRAYLLRRKMPFNFTLMERL